MGALSNYSVRRTGQPDTLDQRFYIEKDGNPISSWHDIPLYASEHDHILNMVIEIPRWSNAKFEIARNELLNPIKQDVKQGKIRFVQNRFPYKGYMWNYGALPSTWEDPSHVYPETQLQGDNDPLDACEIGEAVAYTGQVKQVKVLGLMALLDEGETDFKIIVIDVNDPLASQVNNLRDVEDHFPGLLDATRDWFRLYKVPDGKEPNEIGLREEFQDKRFAFEIIKETHRAWLKMMNGEAKLGEIAIRPQDYAAEIRCIAKGVPFGPGPSNRLLEKWHFIDGTKL